MAKEEIKDTDLTEEDKKKIDEIAEEMESAEGQWEYKLIKPIFFEGQQYDTLHFDFENLTTEDALNIDDELTAKGSATYADIYLCEELLLRGVSIVVN